MNNITRSQDRRQDVELREAIDRVRNNERILNCHQLYESTVAEACRISGSELGLVVTTCWSSADNEFCLSIDAGYGLSGGNLSVAERPASCYPELDVAVNRHRSLVINDAAVFTDFFTDITTAKIHQLLVIPIVDREVCVALLMLANSSAPYDEALAKRFWPLVTTTICTKRKIQNQDSINHEGVFAHRSDATDLLPRIEENAPYGMIVLNANQKIVRFNRAAEKTFGYLSIDAVNRDITELIPTHFPNQRQLQCFAPRFNGVGESLTNRHMGRRADGSSVPVGITIVRYQEYGQPYYLLLVNDRSEIEAIKAEQASQTQRFKAVADLAPIGILQTDRSWRASYANDRWCDISGLSLEEVLDLGWVNGLYYEDLSQTLESLRSSIVAGQEFTGECRFQTPLGEIVWVELHARPMFQNNGEADGFVATLTDCTYRHITEDKLRVMAEQDTLTGLANRALFQDRLEHALKRVDRHGALALLCLDLDGFKNVNDTLGHDCGDILLIEVAKRLSSCVRVEDTVARVGGDEFMILMEDLKNAGITGEISEKILQQMELPFQISGQEVFISTSIGVSFSVGPQVADAKTLLKQGDIALYRAKTEGRNNYQFYSPELEGASKERLFLGNCLHRALDRAEFQVYYQLQADVNTGKIIGSEALLRWVHPERGLLEPTHFISLLEETGLITPVSRWVWYRAFNDHKGFIDAGLMPADASISINLSPRQLREQHLVTSLERAIREAGLKTSQITVEITESALLEESTQTGDVIRAIRALGAQVALDDFGTGYSSLTYLKRYAIDSIKIDQTFIRDLLEDPEDAAITQAVLVLAKSLNLHTVSEGVENAETLNHLNKWQCDSYQGYYLNTPCSEEELRRILLRQLAKKVVTLNTPPQL